MSQLYENLLHLPDNPTINLDVHLLLVQQSRRIGQDLDQICGNQQTRLMKLRN